MFFNNKLWIEKLSNESEQYLYIMGYQHQYRRWFVIQFLQPLPKFKYTINRGHLKCGWTYVNCFAKIRFCKTYSDWRILGNEPSHSYMYLEPGYFFRPLPFSTIRYFLLVISIIFAFLWNRELWAINIHICMLWIHCICYLLSILRLLSTAVTDIL